MKGYRKIGTINRTVLRKRPFWAVDWQALPPMGERPDHCRWQRKGGERVAAVDKIEEKRKPEDFVGHRNRMVLRKRPFWAVDWQALPPMGWCVQCGAEVFAEGEELCGRCKKWTIDN